MWSKVNTPQVLLIGVLIAHITMIFLGGCNGTTRGDFLQVRFLQHNINIFLEGETNLASISFQGKKLEHTFDGNKTISITGTGTIIYKKCVINIYSDFIEVNGKRLPTNEINFVFRTDGTLVEGFLHTWK